MNGAQLHLMLNHLPVMGALFSLLLLGWSLIRRSTEIQKLALGGARCWRDLAACPRTSRASLPKRSKRVNLALRSTVAVQG